MARMNFRLSGEILGLAGGRSNVNVAAITSAAAVGEMNLVTLASGANTIALETDVTVVLVIPPSDNTETITLKGVAGDTGIALNVNKPFMFCPDSGAADFVLTAGAEITGVEIWQL